MAIILQEGGKCAAPGCGAVLTDFFGHKQCRGHAPCRTTRGPFGECHSLFESFSIIIAEYFEYILTNCHNYLHLYSYNDIYIEYILIFLCLLSFVHTLECLPYFQRPCGIRKVAAFV